MAMSQETQNKTFVDYKFLNSPIVKETSLSTFLSSFTLPPKKTARTQWLPEMNVSRLFGGMGYLVIHGSNILLSIQEHN